MAGLIVRVALRVLREPFAQFMLAGAVIYLGTVVVKSSLAPTIHMDQSEVEQLVSYWQAQMQRAPTSDELNSILRERIDEEILAQEAIRLGLDKGDMIIRRRLAQKMAFANEDTTPVIEPTDDQLRAYYNGALDRFRVPTHVAMRHVFFSTDRRGDQALADANAVLKTGKPDISGDPFILPTVYNDVSLGDLLRDYGPEFADAVAKAKLGAWSGPFKSAYGWHLIKIEDRKDAAIAPFDDVRSDVREAYLNDMRKSSNAAYLNRLRAQYRVEFNGASRPNPADGHE